MSYLNPDCGVASDLTPFFVAYPWLSGSGGGFGTKYPDPASPQDFECIAASWSPDGKDISTGGYDSPWISAYQWLTGPGNGFGTRYADPGTLPPTTLASNLVAWTPSGAAVVDVYNTGGGGLGMISYHWTTGAGNGFGSTYSDPGTNPGTFPQAFAFSSRAKSATSVDMIVCNTGSAPHIQAYPWTDAGGYGTKYSNPGTDPGGTIFICYSPNGADMVGVRSFGTPVVYAFPWSVGVGWGTIYAAPGTLPPGINRGCQFSPSGADVAIAQAVASGVSPCIGAYAWASGFGTKYADPGTSLPDGSNAYCVAFTPPGNDVAIAFNGPTAPWVAAYPWTTGSGFGTQYADPATVVGKNANAIGFSPAARNNGVAPLGIFGDLPSPTWLAALALGGAIMENPTVSRRGMFGLNRS